MCKNNTWLRCSSKLVCAPGLVEMTVLALDLLRSTIIGKQNNEWSQMISNLVVYLWKFREIVGRLMNLARNKTARTVRGIIWLDRSCGTLHNCTEKQPLFNHSKVPTTIDNVQVRATCRMRHQNHKIMVVSYLTLGIWSLSWIDPSSLSNSGVIISALEKMAMIQLSHAFSRNLFLRKLSITV